MANPQRGEVKLNLGGRDRVLKFTLDDIAQIQDETGIDSVTRLVSKGMGDARVVKKMLYRAILHAEPTLRPEDIGSLDEMVYADVITAIRLAFKRFANPNAPDREERAEPGKAPAA